jgi:hypothetical protein
MKDIYSLTMDELHGILMAHEMRTKKENPSKREATFKSSKKTKNRENGLSDILDNESYANEAYFMKKLKKGTGNYKGKLPFKCFNCGKVGHFVVKCPYVKNESIDDEEDHNIKKERKHHHHKRDKHEKKRNIPK